MNKKELAAKKQQMIEERKKIQRFNNAASIIFGFIGATLSLVAIGAAYEYNPMMFGLSMFWPITSLLIGFIIFFIALPIEEANSTLQ